MIIGYATERFNSSTRVESPTIYTEHPGTLPQLAH